MSIDPLTINFIMGKVHYQSLPPTLATPAVEFWPPLPVTTLSPTPVGNVRQKTFLDGTLLGSTTPGMHDIRKLMVNLLLF